jgi:phospholipid/cholesterol/gamma-HCH transport system substrate-binding protein
MIRYSRESRFRYMLLGIVYLLVAALVVGTTVAIYRKAFTPVVSVRLETDRIGSQLRPGADVKVRGVVVGEEAVRPDQLAVTLNALATALQGRGERLGETLVDLEAYLRELHPAVPDLVAVFEHLAPVSETYAEAAPDLLTALAELTTTTRTFDEQDTQLRELYAEVTGAAEDLTGFLEANRENTISLVTTSRPTLELLARYAPEYPCLFRQLVEGIPRAETVFGKGSEHPEIQRLTIEITASRGKYRPGVDAPEYADRRGPRCYETPPHPAVFPQYPPGGPVKDGSTTPAPPSTEEDPDLLPGLGTVVPSSTEGSPQGAAAQIAAVANSPAEQQLISLLMAPTMGVMPAEVPAWSSLLVGPLLRGTEVTLS